MTVALAIVAGLAALLAVLLWLRLRSVEAQLRDARQWIANEWTRQVQVENAKITSALKAASERDAAAAATLERAVEQARDVPAEPDSAKAPTASWRPPSGAAALLALASLLTGLATPSAALTCPVGLDDPAHETIRLPATCPAPFDGRLVLDEAWIRLRADMAEANVLIPALQGDLQRTQTERDALCGRALAAAELAERAALMAAAEHQPPSTMNVEARIAMIALGLVTGLAIGWAVGAQ